MQNDINAAAGAHIIAHMRLYRAGLMMQGMAVRCDAETNSTDTHLMCMLLDFSSAEVHSQAV